MAGVVENNVLVRESERFDCEVDVAMKAHQLLHICHAGHGIRLEEPFAPTRTSSLHDQLEVRADTKNEDGPLYEVVGEAR